MDGNYGYSSYHNGGPGKEKEFHRLAQTIGTSIQKISQNVSSMQRMVNQLGTTQDSQELKTQLHQIQHYTQQLAKDTNSNLKELNAIPMPTSQSEQRQWKMQKERLAEEFTAALSSFQATQRRAAQKEKEDMQRVRANSGFGDPFAGGFAPPGGRRSEQLIELQDQHERQQAQLQEERDLIELEEREQAIRQLESDISDVNQIFKDLGAMVHEQGEVIDSIEAHVEKTEIFVAEGAQQVRQASHFQSKARMKKFILFSCLAVVLIVVISIIVWQVS
ncbi:hypothetical protein B566_EDAN006956 [Ephemera danica]|nr:hypothetical protein B566_EDAN006956 [Ephemera danica]